MTYLNQPQKNMMFEVDNYFGIEGVDHGVDIDCARCI